MSAAWLEPRGILQRLFANRAAVLAFGFLLLLCAVAALAPLISPHDPDVQNLRLVSKGPGSEHWLGTDPFGRDTLSRLLFGSRVTLLAALEGVGIGFLLGAPAGLMAGYFGGWFDDLVSRIADALLSMPGLILAFAIVGVLGPGIHHAMIAIGIIFSPRFFRIARASAATIRHENYIVACRVMGCGTTRVLLRHVLPNSSGPLLVQVTFTTGLVIVAEASLSFVGLGVQSPQSSWGTMINEAFQVIQRSTWPLIPPSLAVMFTVLAFTVFGDALRDAMGRTSQLSV